METKIPKSSNATEVKIAEDRYFVIIMVDRFEVVAILKRTISLCPL
jgi:hypothetical protein